MSEIRFSIETTYTESGEEQTYADSYVIRGPAHDFESDQIEGSNLLGQNRMPLSTLGAFFWFSEVMATMSAENRLLEHVMRLSSAENELQRDNTKCIDVTSQKYCEHEGKEEKCIICSDKFNSGEEVAVLQCEHVFHQHCIQEWGHYKAECPLCKKRIPLAKENLATDKDGMEETNKAMDR